MLHCLPLNTTWDLEWLFGFKSTSYELPWRCRACRAFVVRKAADPEARVWKGGAGQWNLFNRAYGQWVLSLAALLRPS